MTEKIPSHRKQRAAPRQCVTTYITTAEGDAEEKKPAKSDSSKAKTSEVNN